MSHVSASGLPIERPEDCGTRMLYSGIAGFVIGGFAGGVTANWSEVPLVLRNQSFLALKRTGQRRLHACGMNVTQDLKHPVMKIITTNT